MKTLLKSFIGLVAVLCLTTSCDFTGIDETMEEHTEQASGSGGSDDEPCQDRCD
jgi:hypothetical protein